MKRMLNDIFRSPWTFAVLGFGLLVTACIAVAVLKEARPEALVREFDRQKLEVLDFYHVGSFTDVANRLNEFTQYVERNRAHLLADRDVDMVLEVVCRKLAYMSLHVNQPAAALTEFERAHTYHGKRSVRHGIVPITKSQYVDSVIQGVEKTDQKDGAKWKDGLVLNTNVLAAVQEAFAAP
jgi:hypothetical protein